MIFGAQEVITPTIAHADTESGISFADDYPHHGALDHNVAEYEWWVDENGNGNRDVTASETDNDELVSSRGYYYRNCTDGAAYWVQKYLGVGLSGWHHGKDWDESAAARNIPVKAGNATNIEPGDIAQSDDGLFGHVGFVTNVVKNEAGAVVKIRTAELNKDNQGGFTWHWSDSKNSSDKFIRTASGRDWDHFIDVNGSSPPPRNSQPLRPQKRHRRPKHPWRHERLRCRWVRHDAL